MSWPAAVPVMLLAAFWMIGPGLLVALVSGLRGIVAWGAAPVLSVGLVSASAVVAGELGLHWGAAVPAGAAVLAAAGALGGRHLLRRRAEGAASVDPVPIPVPVPVPVDTGSGIRGALARLMAARGGRTRPGSPDGPWAGVAATAGMAVAVVLGWISSVPGMGRPDAVSQSFDVNFHYNAVARILDTGDASSMDVGRLVSAADTAFYPSAWHGMVSLIAPYAGAPGIVTGSNMMALVVVLIAWPLSCLLLVRQVVGRSAGAALATPVISLGFVAFPWTLVTYGALWPNLIGVALMPAVLAAVVTFACRARHSTLGRGGAVVLAGAGSTALGLAHPNAVFGMAVVGLCPMVWALAGFVRVRLRRRRWVPAIAAALAAIVMIGAVAWLMFGSQLLAGVRSYTWDPIETWQQGVVSVLTNSPNGHSEAWAISILVVVGAVVALRRTSWLSATHVLTGMLYVVAASTSASPWTGVWYNDSPRLAAMVPITAVPLAVLGVLAVAGLIRRVLAASPDTGWLRRPRPAALVAFGVAALVVFSGGLYQISHTESLASIYRHPADPLLEPGQEEFLERAGEMLPADAVVAQSPWAGNAMLWALTDRQVLFPHLMGTWTPEQIVIGTRLHDAATDPSVCAALAATDVGYALTGPPTLWSWNPDSVGFTGLDGLDTAPGFELMTGDDVRGLYRITACDPVTAIGT
ncbi:MAG: hypothetical protein L0I76_10530 [Pseudonocardia sp.]|nr:hypothetical protein [Pseudonocardia sp.]